MRLTAGTNAGAAWRAQPNKPAGAWDSSVFRAMVLLLACAFLLGGSARGDVASLIVLRPLAVCLLAYALWRLQWAHIREHWFLMAMALAVVALPLVHLVPLPPEMWRQLPGRQVLDDIARVTGINEIPRPLSLTPEATRNAAYALLVPLAALVLGIQLTARERMRLLPLILLLGAASAFLGLAQTLSDPEGLLYLYAVTNNGSAVGLFANRNHNAVLLAMLLPMLAVFAYGVPSASANRGILREFVVLLGCILVIPLILITGSRLGLVAAAIASILIPLILVGTYTRFAPGEPPLQRFLRVFGLPLLLVGLVMLGIWLGRALAWDKLVGTRLMEEERARIIPVLLDMIREYFPAGSGIGSFQRVYQLHEPDELLSPYYMNHAHNDWLEILLTGGLAAAVLLAIAGIAFGVCALHVFSRRREVTSELVHARLGLAVILIAALGSWSDYPLRTPALSSVFVVALLWTSCRLAGFRASEPEELR
jgi:O-antigen ligase